MATISYDENPHWFVLNHFGGAFQTKSRKVVDAFNDRNGKRLELFTPTYTIMEENKGKTKMKIINLTFNYVFVRGVFADVQNLCSQNKDFSLLINHGSTKRYAIISDIEMKNLKDIARIYENHLPYFPLDDINLEDGDLVEIINGDFPGLIGTYMPKAKSNSGNIVLRLFNNIGTIIFNIKATDVRILEFSHTKKRANDQVDAIILPFLDALLLYHENQPIPTNLVAKLTVFCRRMAIVNIKNLKLEAKLLILLFGCNFILGNLNDATKYKTKFEKIRTNVTNKWTLALINLIYFVTENNPEHLEFTKSEFPSLNHFSKNQLKLAETYNLMFSLQLGLNDK